MRANHEIDLAGEGRGDLIQGHAISSNRKRVGSIQGHVPVATRSTSQGDVGVEDAAVQTRGIDPLNGCITELAAQCDDEYVTHALYRYVSRMRQIVIYILRIDDRIEGRLNFFCSCVERNGYCFECIGHDIAVVQCGPYHVRIELDDESTAGCPIQTDGLNCCKIRRCGAVPYRANHHSSRTAFCRKQAGYRSRLALGDDLVTARVDVERIGKQ